MIIMLINVNVNPIKAISTPDAIGFAPITLTVWIPLELVTSRAEPSFEHFELGLLIYE